MGLKMPLYDRTSEGNCAFLGLRMCQNRLAVPVLSYVLETGGFAQVIELGTQLGGLSVLLGLQCKLLGAQMHTIDREDRTLYPELLNDFGVTCHRLDLFSAEGNALVEGLVKQAGRTLLLCDNGDKAREFALFAPCLKSGDVIGAHDYHPDGDYDAKRWAWHELHDSEVAAVCDRENLLPYLAEDAIQAAWLLRVKG